MRAAPALIITLLVAVPVAGCLSGAPAGGTDAAGTSDDTLQTVRRDRLDRSTNASDWFFAPMQATPDGEIRSFPWTVPGGVDAVEVVPMVDDPSAVTSWGLLKFRTARDQAVLSGGVLNPTVETTERSLSAVPDRRTATASPSVEPLQLPVHAGPGETVVLVVLAEGTRSTDFDVAIRPVPASALGSPAVEDVATFEAQVQNRTGIELPVVGQAERFQIPAYLEVNAIGSGGFEVRTPSVEVRGDVPVDLRPVGQVRDVTLVSDFPVDSGWGLAVGGYVHAAGPTRWSVDASMHDHELASDGISVVSNNRTRSHLGSPLFFLTGGGSGASHVAFQVQGAHANVDEIVVLLQIDLAETLTTLVGDKGRPVTFSMDGSLGSVQLDGADVVAPLSSGGTLRVRGLAPPAP